MQQTIVDTATNRSSQRKPWIAAIILLFVFVIGLLAYRALAISSLTKTSASIAPITQDVFEQSYGLHVNLVGVTAAGGMVDLRLKILDAAKAKQLLQAQPPTLWVVERKVLLTAPPDSQTQAPSLENGAMYFVMFPNTRNAVKPGDHISL